MTFTKQDIERWASTYDILKYPISIYQELVIDNKDHNNKIELMGAWKTGSIRIDNNTLNPIYIDNNGSKYRYTKRWKKETPVGYEVWKDISQNITDIKKKIPKSITRNSKPDILGELERKKGFGFIWSIFVLHCIDSKTYPLYDQHVYRAYKYITSDGKEKPNTAPNFWTDYYDYVQYFKNHANLHQVSFETLDRALWTYGKDIKNNTVQSSKISTITYSDTYIDDWCHLTTLSTKAKVFWWKLNQDMSLTIMRKFDQRTGNIKHEYTILENEINNLQKFLASKKMPLANNVQKLSKGIEKEGIGSFLYNELNWQNTTKAQLASHIASIFVNANIWSYNNKSREMLFWIKTENWQDNLILFQHQCTSMT